MNHSFAQKSEIVCPDCSQTTIHSVWVIIDTDEHPNLLSSVMTGNLNTVECPQCHSNLGKLDAPLLIYEPNQQDQMASRLIFSPALQCSKERDYEHMQQLVGMLTERANANWTDEWINDNLQNVPPPALPMVLGANLSGEEIAVLGLALDNWLREKEQIENNSSHLPGTVGEESADESNNFLEERLTLIRQFVNQESWKESYHFAQTHSEILDDETLEILEMLIAEMRSDGNEQGVVILTEHLNLLQVSREQGLAEAFRSRLQHDELEIPSELQSLMFKVSHLNSPQQMPARIALLEQALSHIKRESNPKLWAVLHGELGSSLQQNPRGSITDNLEQAIQHVKQALEVQTRDSMPAEWAISMLNLGNIYFERIEGERAQNIELAIHYYERALQVQTRAAMPTEWARAVNNLAGAYLSRIHGGRADNIEKAIQFYEQALQVQTRTAMPIEWATTITNLASAYDYRILEERAQNIEKSIELFEQAREELTEDYIPDMWASTTANLAFAYYRRKLGERADNVERAIQLYEQALRVQKRDVMPFQWAKTTVNEALAYVARVNGDPAQNIERAIHLYEEALKEITRIDSPYDWAKIITNQALAFSVRIEGNRPDNVEKSCHLYRLALNVLTLEGSPAEHQQIQQYLGDIYFGEKQWEDAANAYLGAVEANKLLFYSAVNQAGQMAEVEESAEFFPRAVYALLHSKRYGEAFEQLDTGKTRLLARIMGIDNANLELLTEEEQTVFVTAREQFRMLQAERQLPEGSPGRRPITILASLQETSLRQLNDLVDQFNKTYSTFMPVGLDLPQLLALIPNEGALVAPLLTSQGSAVFILPAGTSAVTMDHVLWLDDLTTDTVQQWLVGSEDTPGWLRLYLDSQSLPSAERLTSRMQALDALLPQLWQQLMAPIHQRLQALDLPTGAPLLLLPQGGLGLLPLHAARPDSDDSPCFLDHYTLTYAPSGYAHHISRQRAVEPQRQARSLTAAVNPTGDLRYTPLEGKAIANLFPETARQVLDEAMATQEALLANAPVHAYFHFSGHGYYNWLQPMQSGLLLADAEPLTLARIMSEMNLGQTRLVTLSACESGMTDIRQSPDEYLGLPAGFLQAGAPAVVGTLWAVLDISTMLLMERFYQLHLQGGRALPDALRQAQLWLRQVTAEELAQRFGDEYKALMSDRMSAEEAVDFWQQFARMHGDQTPFAHPYFWAAFTFSGA